MGVGEGRIRIERLDSLFRRLLLGQAPGRSLTDSTPLPLHPHLHPEPAGMAGALLIPPVFGRLALRGQQFLQQGFGVAGIGCRRFEGDRLPPVGHHQSLGRFPPSILVDRSDHSLHGVGQNAFLAAATRLDLALSQPEGVPQLERLRHLGQGFLSHHRRPHPGHLALPKVGVLAEEVAGNHELQDRVAQEFQPLVVGDVSLIGIGAVGKGGKQQLR